MDSEARGCALNGTRMAGASQIRDDCEVKACGKQLGDEAAPLDAPACKNAA